MSGGSDSPSGLCTYTDTEGSTGSHNADQTRTSPASSGGPILINITPVTDCSDSRLTSYSGDANLCQVATSNAYCGVNDIVAVFRGEVWDPSGSFQTSEGTSLDQQFLRVIEWTQKSSSSVGNGDPLTYQYYGSIQDGHIVPDGNQWDGSSGWDSNGGGGTFEIWRCFSAYDNSPNEEPPSYIVSAADGYIPAFYAKTGSAPGNTFCSTWVQ
jgi:hypothetical protein